jgi:hypothetical protein
VEDTTFMAELIFYNYMASYNRRIHIWRFSGGYITYGD